MDIDLVALTTAALDSRRKFAARLAHNMLRLQTDPEFRAQVQVAARAIIMAREIRGVDTAISGTQTSAVEFATLDALATVTAAELMRESL